MGCTSSAPNSLASPTSATGKTLKFSEDMQEQSSPEIINTNMKTENISVLPTPGCDTDNVDDLEKLAKNNNSIVDINKMDTQKSGSEFDEHEESEDTEPNNFETTVQVEEKLTSLEEVVEKVVEIISERNSHSSSFNDLKTIGNHSATPEVFAENKDNGNSNEEKQQHGESNVEPEDKASTVTTPEAVSEPASPSQSSGCVTRWEALADIAAELPPSLAVDRVTGEIFTHAK